MSCHIISRSHLAISSLALLWHWKPHIRCIIHRFDSPNKSSKSIIQSNPNVHICTTLSLSVLVSNTTENELLPYWFTSKSKINITCLLLKSNWISKKNGISRFSVSARKDKRTKINPCYCRLYCTVLYCTVWHYTVEKNWAYQLVH